MEFFDKLTKKASETYKGAAEKTSKLAKEAKLKLKINENKSKINDLYQEIGKKVYQKHTETGDVCIKKDLEEECAKIDILSAEIEKYHKEILDLSDLKKCVKCNEPMDKNAKFCPKCGEEQPAIEETPAMEVEVVDDGKEATEEKVSDKNEEEKPAEPVNTNPVPPATDYCPPHPRLTGRRPDIRRPAPSYPATSIYAKNLQAYTARRQ